MPTYLFNVQNTIEVEAESEDEAYDLLLADDEERCIVIDSDIMLVEGDVN